MNSFSEVRSVEPVYHRDLDAEMAAAVVVAAHAADADDAAVLLSMLGLLADASARAAGAVCPTTLAHAATRTSRSTAALGASTAVSCDE